MPSYGGGSYVVFAAADRKSVPLITPADFFDNEAGIASLPRLN